MYMLLYRGASPGYYDLMNFAGKGDRQAQCKLYGEYDLQPCRTGKPLVPQVLQCN
jgi:hypothetical protein